MRKTILIILIIFIQIPAFGYKVVRRQFLPQYPNYNYGFNLPMRNYGYSYPYYNYYSPLQYRISNPIKRIKNYFIGVPTGYTLTPQHSVNNQNSREFFSDNGGDEYYYDNGGYYKRNRETTGGGSVTIIND